MTPQAVEQVRNDPSVGVGLPSPRESPSASTSLDRGQRRIRLFYLISLPIWAAVVIRAASDTSLFEGISARRAAALLLAFAALLSSERSLSSSVRWYPQFYFALQTGIVLSLMVLLPNLDYFAALFIPMSAQAMLVCSRPVGYRWIAALTLAMVGGLLATQDWPKSASLVVMYAGAFFFVASYATVTQRAEAAREESQALLADLAEAYSRLEASTAQVRALAHLRALHAVQRAAPLGRARRY